MNANFSLLHRCARLVAGGALIFFAATALADSPAAISDASRSRAEDQFHQFAKTWMANVQRLQTQDRDKPTVRAGANGTQTSFRGYGEDYSVELRPTGHPSAPYVGLLRYTELMYSCPSASSKDCSVSSRVPVTEIFRYENGRWSY
ncbi:MAG TPA: hypothetical protein VII72_06930 [Myxococcota bacterium]|jgi:hypothetical protein